LNKELKRSIKEILEIFKRLYCFKCEYAEECSPDSPEYLYRCRLLEDWVIKYYRKQKGEEESG